MLSIPSGKVLLQTLCFGFLLAFLSCDEAADTTTTQEDVTTTVERPDPNPAAPDFNAADSDERAIAIADSVVWAHGGRRAFDQNRYFSWNFLGMRDLLWDKEEERVRIEFPDREAIYLLDIEDMSGRVQLAGEEVTHPDSLNKYLEQARDMWINDSYWLIHQFKLKDSGVTLKYGGEVAEDPEAKRPSYVLDQTFADVGKTPNNRYRIFVDQETFHINTWQYFRNAEDEEASIVTSWSEYEEYEGGLLLSGDRSGRFQLGSIATPTTVEESRFTTF